MCYAWQHKYKTMGWYKAKCYSFTQKSFLSLQTSSHKPLLDWVQQSKDKNENHLSHFLCSILYSTNYNISRVRLCLIWFYFKSLLFYKEIKIKNKNTWWVVIGEYKVEHKKWDRRFVFSKATLHLFLKSWLNVGKKKTLNENLTPH